MSRFSAERHSTASGVAGVAGVERRPDAGRMAAGVLLLALAALAWPVKCRPMNQETAWPSQHAQSREFQPHHFAGPAASAIA